MTTAIIGVGNLGRTIARELVAGGEPVVLAASETPNQLATQLGDLATAATVPEAIETADTVILAVWLDTAKDLIEENRERLAGKVVVDPTNPISVGEQGELTRSLPEQETSSSVISSLLPGTARYVKAFGSLSADSLGESANRTPDRAVLFYATDDAEAQRTVVRLISAAGFDPVNVGGAEAAGRIEFGGDLTEFGLNGLVDARKAEAAVGQLG